MQPLNLTHIPRPHNLEPAKSLHQKIFYIKVNEQAAVRQAEDFHSQ